MAQATDPRNFGIFNLAGAIAGVWGRTSDAGEITRQGLEIDPLHLVILSNYVGSLLEAARLHEALAHARMLLDLHAKRVTAHYLIGRVLLAQGKPDAALQEFLQEPSQVFRLHGLAQAYHRLGRKAESDEALAQYIQAYDVACVHAVRGELDEAFAWLDKAYARHDPNLTWLKSYTDLSNLRRDPRWPPLLRKMRLTPSHPLAQCERLG